MATHALVGRDRPAKILRDAVARVLDGRGGLVLVTGEAGIGKTALVAVAAEEARRRRALVLTGTCWDGEGAPGYWPWVQVARSLERAVTGDEWTRVRSAAGEGLDHLLGDVGAPPHADGADPAFRICDAVTSLLIAAARVTPVVAVVEDLHWADPASLRLLDFTVRHTALDPVLVLGTYRDVEIETRDHPLRPLVRALMPHATTVELSGLDLDAVAAMIARVAGRDPDAGLVAEVVRRTGGNPFFVEQAARLWGAGGPIAAVAPAVGDALERRIARLPAGVAGVLARAAILGTEFDIPLLAELSGLPIPETERMVGEAESARLVSALGKGRRAFVHDLVRETLCASLDAEEARLVHAAVIRAVEATPGAAALVPPAQRARHALVAVPLLDPATALIHVLSAARDASARLATEEACAHYGRAIELIPMQASEERAAVALELGADQRRAGDLAGARRTFEGVLDAARRVEDPRLLAEAVLGLHGLGHALEGEDLAIGLIDDAYEALVDRGEAAHSPLAARLLAAAARARSHHAGEDRDHAERLSARAVELARACGDDAALGFCLLARHDAIWKPGTASERLAIADELSGAARRLRDRELELQGSLLRTVALLELGDPRGLAEHDAFVTVAERSRLPRGRYMALSRQGTIATLTGHFDEARTLVDEALRLGERLGEVDRVGLWGDQVWEIACLQGRHNDVEALIADLRAAGDPHVLVLETRLAVDRGDAELALRRLPELEELGRRWPRWAALTWLALLAEVAAASRDPVLCARVRAGIAPFRDQWAVLGGAVIVHGPMEHWAALVDAAEQRWDEAVAGFTRARCSAERLRARPWSVAARLHLAEALLGRGVPGDRAAAAELLGGVEREAVDMGMGTVALRARQALAGLEAAVRPDPDVFCFDGELWTLTFDGRTARLPDSKGLRDLHTLLSQHGREVPAEALVDPHRWRDAARSEAGADHVLDDRARLEHRDRLDELDDEIAAANDLGDDARLPRLETEREALIAELRRATGLGGCSRLLGDETERIRKTVTARIRDALRRLDSRHPELARHLRAHVSTGTVCRYEPADGRSWRL